MKDRNRKMLVLALYVIIGLAVSPIIHEFVHVYQAQNEGIFKKTEIILFPPRTEGMEIFMTPLMGVMYIPEQNTTTEQIIEWNSNSQHREVQAYAVQIASAFMLGAVTWYLVWKKEILG